MNKETVTANYLKTICWLNNEIIDWAEGGEVYYPVDQKKQLGKYSYAFRCDAAIISADGQYAFIYKRFDTKGLLLKNGELIREINRSYYCAESYEYPAAFVTVDDVTYLIHCPLEYCRLDFENVETGELITNIPGRGPFDTFHSRLEVSADSKWLISKGWRWHPVDVVELFNIEECIKNPLLLDKAYLVPDLNGVDISTAGFIDNTRILLGTGEDAFSSDDKTLPEKLIATWDITTNKINNPVKVKAEFGNLFVINERYAWDTFSYPKIVDLVTGDIVDKEETIHSGTQQSSVASKKQAVTAIFNRNTGQLAIKGDEEIYVLTPDEIHSK